MGYNKKKRKEAPCMDQTCCLELLQRAEQAKQHAYVPYSHFRVGACILCEDGRMFSGCNVENASYGATICAERTALTKAVSEGARTFAALALTCDQPDPVFPCGICLQMLCEFGNFPVLISGKDVHRYQVFMLDELIPHAFTQADLQGDRRVD